MNFTLPLVIIITRLSKILEAFDILFLGIFLRSLVKYLRIVCNLIFPGFFFLQDHLRMHKHEDYWGCLHVCIAVCLSVCGSMFFSSILMPLSLCRHCLIHCMPLFLPNKMLEWWHQSKSVYVVHTFR